MHIEYILSFKYLVKQKNDYEFSNTEKGLKHFVEQYSWYIQYLLCTCFHDKYITLVLEKTLSGKKFGRKALL